jgi:hypothetical protein
MVELLLTDPGEQWLFFGGKPQFFIRISVKGMRVVFLPCHRFSSGVNKQLFVPVFII